ncbi:hypothetical protein [Capillimicrobium parvum]|uniref:Uncharacterized protein n=1 Tax=Capillimicrobium parvum TaxID=2884022 RepID=A0A9E6XVS4_9ACTN|nr:hypothetical protein [Capillimicrobium parvum]UGS35349.1 hypothetical protein DSM104329_01737 [Capillimicrobium parvum]
MSTALSLLDLIERPSILDVDRDGRAGVRVYERDGGRESSPGCEHDRVRRPEIGRERSDRGDRAVPAVGGAPTLDDLLTGIWQTIASDQTATCPLCQGALEPRYSAGSVPVGGRCTSCGTELS